MLMILISIIEAFNRNLNFGFKLHETQHSPKLSHARASFS